MSIVYKYLSFDFSVFLVCRFLTSFSVLLKLLINKYELKYLVILHLFGLFLRIISGRRFVEKKMRELIEVYLLRKMM